MEKVFWKVFEKRSLLCFFVLIFLLFVSILRITVINAENYREVQANMGSKKIKIQNQRGTIFDCNGYPLTNNKKKIIACISPTPRAITAISTVLKGDALDAVLDTLQSGNPAVCEVPKIIECDGIICTEIYTDDNYIPAIHTIGYNDNQNTGVSGIQKAYNSFLTVDTPLSVRFACDGKGGILAGISPEIENKASPLTFGIVTTIDITVQNVVESYASFLGEGAIIVASAKNSKIRGIASYPTFTTDNIENLLSDDKTPLYNRTLGSYNVGSVFKPCVAAAGIENNFENYKYTCKGSFKIIDRIFKCHEAKGHGFTDLKHAIAHSCNTYFYNLGIRVEKQGILNMASNLNFGKAIRLCDNILTSKGSLPNTEKLDNTAHLANFSIGQGDFTASPISLLPLYCAIASGGKYYMPSLIEGQTQNGCFTSYDYGSPTKVFSEKTANMLKDALSLVISEGTGTKANPKTVTAAGKTATAQTGKYKNGKEIKSSWFCGFFPRENPQYVVIVFCEDTTEQTKSSAEIFAEIADKINSLE